MKLEVNSWKLTFNFITSTSFTCILICGEAKSFHSCWYIAVSFLNSFKTVRSNTSHQNYNNNYCVFVYRGNKHTRKSTFGKICSKIWSVNLGVLFSPTNLPFQYGQCFLKKSEKWQFYPFTLLILSMKLKNCLLFVKMER